MAKSPADKKVDAYYREMKSFRNKVALGTAWDVIEPKFNDLHSRLEKEPVDIQKAVSLKGLGLAEMAITFYGAMPSLVFNAAAKKLAKSMPTDLTTTKRSMESVRQSIGDQLSPRIVFYYNAVSALPDDHPDNPREMLNAMRAAYKIK